jgi:hypothetical protein
VSKVEEWLSEFSKPNTQRNYKVRLYKFFDATGLNEHRLMNMSPEEIRHELMVYRTNQLAKGNKQNSVLTVINSVRSFLVQIDKPIKFRRGALGKGQADTDSHIFTNGDLKKLYDVGSTQEKALIATAASLGWEISAFLDLNRAKVASFIAHAKDNGEKFIFRDDIRDKNGEPRLAIFNPLAIEALTTYLETTENTSSKLFPYTSDGVQKMLNRLAKDSGLKTTGSIRFHNIRKWLMSRLSRCGFADRQINYVLGKSISISDRTYLQDLMGDIEAKYPTYYEDYLNISPKPKNSEKINEKVTELSKEFAEKFVTLEEEREKDRQKIEQLQNQLGKIQELTDYLVKAPKLAEIDKEFAEKIVKFMDSKDPDKEGLPIYLDEARQLFIQLFLTQVGKKGLVHLNEDADIENSH